MIEADGVSKRFGEQEVLRDVSFSVGPGDIFGIVGCSGAGKSTLLRCLNGLEAYDGGSVRVMGREVASMTERELRALRREMGMIFQNFNLMERKNVEENIAWPLEVWKTPRNEIVRRVGDLLDLVGLAEKRTEKIRNLSGGQKQRVGIARALALNPKILLCDEVTSGLDPRSEREIVRLLHDLSRKDGRIVLSVTHSLAHLELYDSILVLHEGTLAFHGPPEKLTHYFSVKDSEEVYPRLATQTAERWQSSWQKHGPSYYKMLEHNRELLISSGCLHLPAERPPAQERSAPEPENEGEKEAAPPSAPSAATLPMPGFFSQFSTLLSRRWRIFFRDRAQVALQLAILICFPILVTLFSDKAAGNIRRFSDTRQTDLSVEIQEQQNVRADQAKVGSAVSGIIMFQVVLLALMGSNNSAREIAGERPIYEKERFAGLRPSAYLASKVAFLACLVIAQSLWMAYFVNFFGQFRGDFFQHQSKASGFLQ